MSGVTLSTPDSTGRVTPVDVVDPQPGVLDRGEDGVDRELEAPVIRDDENLAVGGFDPGAELSSATPGLDHAALRLALHPPGPAERALPACVPQLLRQFQDAARPLTRQLFHGMHRRSLRRVHRLPWRPRCVCPPESPRGA
jgi:hypothetical protein